MFQRYVPQFAAAARASARGRRARLGGLGGARGLRGCGRRAGLGRAARARGGRKILVAGGVASEDYPPAASVLFSWGSYEAVCARCVASTGARGGALASRRSVLNRPTRRARWLFASACPSRSILLRSQGGTGRHARLALDRGLRARACRSTRARARPIAHRHGGEIFPDYFKRREGAIRVAWLPDVLRASRVCAGAAILRVLFCRRSALNLHQALRIS